MFLIALVVIGLTTAVRTHGSFLVHKARQTLEADWRAFAPRIKADEAQWATHPLIAKVDGPDAAAFLAQHLRFAGGTWQASLPTPVVGNLTSWGAFWVDHVDDPSLSALDLRWMGQLESFGFWEFEGPAGPYADQPWYASVPMQVFDVIELVAKARLLEGLRAGRAGDAAKDVRALARLLLTTEDFRTTWPAMKLLELERAAFDEALRRGQPVGAWMPVSAADQGSLWRLLDISEGPYLLQAPAELSRWEPKVGACAGLRTGALMARSYRSFVKEEFRDRYVSLALALAKSPCRLRRVRRAWLSDEDPLWEQLAPSPCPTLPHPRAIDCWFSRAALHSSAMRQHYVDVKGELSGDLLQEYRVAPK